jgi:hypothetical protein
VPGDRLAPLPTATDLPLARSIATKRHRLFAGAS